MAWKRSTTRSRGSVNSVRGGSVLAPRPTTSARNTSTSATASAAPMAVTTRFMASGCPRSPAMRNEAAIARFISIHALLWLPLRACRSGGIRARVCKRFARLQTRRNALDALCTRQGRSRCRAYKRSDRTVTHRPANTALTARASVAALDTRGNYEGAGAGCAGRHVAGPGGVRPCDGRTAAHGEAPRVRADAGAGRVRRPIGI